MTLAPLAQAAAPADEASEVDRILERLEAERTRLAPDVQRLLDFKYGSIDDLGPIDAERNRLRQVILPGAESFRADIELLEAEKRRFAVERLQRIAKDGLRPDNVGELSALGRLNRAGKGYWLFEGRKRAVLYYDEKHYLERRAKLDELRQARLRRYRLISTASAAFLLISAVVLWSRFSARGPSARLRG